MFAVSWYRLQALLTANGVISRDGTEPIHSISKRPIPVKLSKKAYQISDPTHDKWQRWKEGKEGMYFWN